MEWTGFTDEQLKRLKAGPERDSHSGSYPPRKPTEGHGQRNRPPNTRPPPQRGRGGRPHVSEPAPLDENQMLSKPKQPQQQRTNHGLARTETPGTAGDPSNHRADGTKTPAQDRQSVSEKAVNKASEVSGEEKRTKPSKESNGPGGGGGKGETAREETGEKVVDKRETSLGKELDEKEGLSRELSKLEEFQQQQKEIEDENQRKKNLLAIAIADRKKKTQAEVKRLAFIQKELSKIEEFLTNDVNILRDKIEEASRHYSDAQKRYQKAEAEFVAAKMHLHKASEHKEALTEHLCTIIRENELRKAKKLEELVEKLDVDNLASFEAEMEAEAAKKAERQRTSSSSSVRSASEDPKRTSSVSSTGDIPSAEASLPTTRTELEATTPPSSSIQGQSSPKSSSDDGALTQEDVTLPNSTSHGTQVKDTGVKDSSRQDLSKPSEQTQE